MLLHARQARHFAGVELGFVAPELLLVRGSYLQTTMGPVQGLKKTSFRKEQCIDLEKRLKYQLRSRVSCFEKE